MTVITQNTQISILTSGATDDWRSVQIGGSARGYQELFAALAIPTTTGQADEPYIYTLLHLVRTTASAAVRIEPWYSCSRSLCIHRLW